MAGIASFAAYVPRWRLPLAAIAGGGREVREGGPEKAVAYFDEDSATMAVAAAVNCLAGFDRARVDGLLFASTTYPYKEKQGASLIAKALDLRRDLWTADLGGSLRAGTGALRAALDAVRAGSAANVLVVASDCRLGAPRSALERNFADGAAALLVSGQDVAAEAQASHAISDEVIDLWRTDDDPFVHSWEDRFVVERYQESLAQAVRGLLEKTGSRPADFARCVVYAPDARSHKRALGALGFDPASGVQDALFGRLGNAGAAFSLLLFAAALEEASPGERLLLASYGDGADAFAFETGERILKLRDKRGVKWHLARRKPLLDYDKYLRTRNLQATEFDRREGGGVSATVHFRDRDEDVSFRGHRCRRCGTLQFPQQRVCYQCFAKDEFESVRLSDRTGKVMSYTFDYFAGSPDPPLIVSMIETEGGCRVQLQMTDADPKEVKLDLPVEFAFRKIHEAGGTPNYFWKCTPVR